MNLFLFALLALSPLPGHTAADGGRERSFDEGWRFHRGDAAGAERPGFPDSAWRLLDLPHDWSIEALPPREQDDIAVLSARDGEWLFKQGDDLSWKKDSFNDAGWQKVVLPAKWKDHSGYDQSKNFGWYRRHISVSPAQRGKDLQIDLGTVMGADEVFFNGVRVGGVGGFPPNFEDFWSNVYQSYRSYPVPARLIRQENNVVAVRVYSPTPGIAGLYDPLGPGKRVGPFDPGASPGGAATGHTVGGVGWYRKSFVIPAADQGRRVELRFDGVYMDADVWINGRHLGNHPYGYTTFAYDISSGLKPAGETNVVAVRVRNLGANSRWYSGSGIYRHTWLTVTGPVHIPLWGVSVTTPRVSPDSATVSVSVSLGNTGARTDARLRVSLIAPDGSTSGVTEAPVTIPHKNSGPVALNIIVTKPNLWSTAQPNLYLARVEITSEDKTLDSTETRFGIRSVEVDAEKGLRINGEPVKLKGACMHHDNGPLGSRAVDRAEERRVELLKGAGFNAIRTSHNPPSPALLDACDRLGMLVMDESFDNWETGKNPMDYHRFFTDWWRQDITSMVLRDRNHPSVIMWSIGNEIAERKTEKGARLAKRLADYVRQLDPTRPVTAAYNEVDDGADPYFAALDVAGYNYNSNRYAIDHQRQPKRIMVGTESLPARIYEYWKQVEEMPWVIGDFVWTGFDYIGESGIGHTELDSDLHSYLKPWPWNLANCGDIDICGFRQPQSYYRDVVWGRSKLELAVRRPLPEGRGEAVGQWGWPDEERSWNWAGQEGRTMQVKVYSTYPEVKLLLNGKEVGTKPISRDTSFNGRFVTPDLGAETALTAVFEVPYATGELRAVGLVDGKEASSAVLRTSGKPYSLRLTADRTIIRADRNDLAYVTVDVLDENGGPVPDAAGAVRFSVTGQGELSGVCSGDPLNTAGFQTDIRQLFRGRALAILRPEAAGGEIILSAETDGLKPAKILVRAE